MGSEGEGGVRKRGGVKEGGGARERRVRERGGVRKRARVRRGEGVKCAHRAWARMVVGAHGCGRVSCVGAYRSWVRIVHGRVSVMSVYQAWASLSSMGGALSSMRDGRPWVVGRGVVVVPGRCLWALGIV